MSTLPPWAQSPAELEADGVDLTRGLTSAVARERLRTCGPNRLAPARRPGVLRLLLSQFLEVMVGLLAAAAVVSLLIGEWTDALLIAGIVFANAGIGFAQEFRAERALDALRRLAQPTAKVRRDGVLQVIPAEEVVVGDLLEVTAGDTIAADARLLTAVDLEVDESLLTGESLPVSKSCEPVPAETFLPERACMLHAGTAVARGHGQGIVTATGMATEVGGIAALLQTTETGRTPLQQRLAQLGKWLAIVVIAVASVIFVIGIAREPYARWDASFFASMLLVSVSLAVAAIPEGLPAVVSVTLALGAQRMAARRAIIRRLAAVETLGSVDVICSDKTGTLTENRMRVGEILPAEGSQNAGDLLTAAVLNSDAEFDPQGKIIGSATECALLEAARSQGISIAEIRRSYQRLGEVPFSSTRKRMTTLYRPPEGEPVLFVKGAAEQILKLCRTGPGIDLQAWQRRAEELARSGRRVLGFARRTWTGGSTPADLLEAERELTFTGLIALVDPPRSEAQAAIARCRSAGIRPIMITGDHPGTATAIAGEVGLVTGNEPLLTGATLEALTDDELTSRAAATSIYARVSPEHKLRIVRAHQAQGRIVAMTGDGVNDAPALKQADIGVAMGITGTDVSREAAAMVLADDNFATIVAAIEEGRIVYDNIRKFVTYLLVSNTGEVLVLFLAMLVGLPLPLLPVHLLWINLITDGLPALALGFEGPEPDVMRRPPRPRREGLLNRSMIGTILGGGFLMAVLALGAFVVVLEPEGGPVWKPTAASLAKARTIAFWVAAFTQLMYVQTVRSFSETVWRRGLWSNYRLSVAVLLTVVVQVVVVQWGPAQYLLRTVPLSLAEFGWATALACIPFAQAELWKSLRGYFARIAHTSPPAQT